MSELFLGTDAVEVSYSSPKKCIHYYACIWAIASDNKYYSEFSHFIHKEVSLGKFHYTTFRFSVFKNIFLANK